MRGQGLRAHTSPPVLSILALFISILSPVSLTQASAAPALVTCVNLQTGTERISHTGSCRYTQEAQANWQKNPSDSPIASGLTAKVINVCSNKESSPVSYQVIRKKCARHQVTTVFSRSGSLPAKPVIAEAVSFGHDSASLKLATDPASNADAPIAFYTITSATVDTRTPIVTQSQRVYYWKDLSLAITTLQASTRYTFTVSATTSDGTSAISALSNQVTTPAYVPPASTSGSNSSIAAPAFTLSSSTEVKTVNNAITGYTITSTGGTIANYAISPAAPAGTTFNTATGLLSGTPTSVLSATSYTITATNSAGSSSRIFSLTVTSSAPAFTLSSTSETRLKGFALAGYTISSTGAAINSYSLVGTLPAGLSFSTSSGLITGTPTETKTATTYTVTGTSGSGETATATYQLRITGDIGDTGPGGGKIFYYLAAGFNCGANFTDTGSPTGGKCKYLEVAPVTWITPSDSTTVLLGNRNDAVQVSGVRLDAYPTVVFDAGDVGLGYKNSIAFRADSRALANTGIRYVRAYNGGSLSDWYVPNSTELNLLVYWSKGLSPNVNVRSTSNASVINGDFNTSYYYYSSSQSYFSGTPDLYQGIIQSFNDGAAGANQLSDSGMRVRPIRAF